MPAADSRLIHFDANFLVEISAERPAPARRVEDWLRGDFVIHVSSIVWSEFSCGPLLEHELKDARAMVKLIEPFIEDHAFLAAELFNLTGRRSRSLMDCMIAAHAIRSEAGLATLNLQDFRRFEKFGLRLA